MKFVNLVIVDYLLRNCEVFVSIFPPFDYSVRIFCEQEVMLLLGIMVQGQE